MTVPANGHLQRAGPLMRRAAIASVSVSLFLVAIKTFAYFLSHSVSMLASLADSALDLFTASLSLLAIRQSLTPADAEHRFGHGKAEPLAGLAQGAFITASALFLVIQAINLAAAAISFPLPLTDTSGNSFQKANEGPPTDPKVFEEQQKKLQEDLQKRADELRKKLESQGQAPPK